MSKSIRYWCCVAVMSCLVACGSETRGYFPTEPGLAWVYAVHVENRREESHHRLLIQSLEPDVVQDRTLLPRRRHDGSTAYYTLDKQGVLYLGEAAAGRGDRTFDEAGEQMLPLPPRAGTTWRRTVETALIPQSGCGICTITGRVKETMRLRYRVVDVSAVTQTPAGVFSDCILLHGSGSVSVNADPVIGPVKIQVDIREWYAPGVGLVEMSWRERPNQVLFSEGELRMELSAFLTP